MKNYILLIALFLSLTISGQSIELDHTQNSLKVLSNASDVGIQIGYYNPGSQLIGNHIIIKEQDGGNETIKVFGGNQGSGAFVNLADQTGVTRIRLDPDYFTQSGPKGRIITDQLEIKAGSDLAEYFDISSTNTIQAGHIASIDPNQPGKLTLSGLAYDQKVAGIISGANGLSTGMFMGQTGSIADGSHPVALTGRAYVYASEENGDIQPGDFLTSSSVPGYAMKVKKRRKANGAIIGKAMTPIDENGFVLVLINLQ